MERVLLLRNVVQVYTSCWLYDSTDPALISSPTTTLRILWHLFETQAQCKNDFLCLDLGITAATKASLPLHLPVGHSLGGIGQLYGTRSGKRLVKPASLEESSQ